MGWLRNIERWFRRTILNPGKQSLAAELGKSLPQIESAIDQAILRYAESVGGQPLAVFVSVAIANLGLSERVRKFVESLLPRLGAGSSRGVRGLKSREEAAREDVAPLLAAIREEAGKA